MKTKSAMTRKFCTYLFLLVCMAWISSLEVSAMPGYGLQSRVMDKTITQSDGLPGNNVFQFVRDHNRLMWICTKGGLCSYNGNSIVNYPMDTIPGVKVSCSSAIETPDGELLAGFKTGLYRVDKQARLCRKICPEIQSVNNFVICQDNVYLCNTQGLWQYSDGKCKALVFDSHVMSQQVIDICTDKAKKGLWLMCGEQIYYFDVKTGKSEKYDVPRELVKGFLKCGIVVGEKLYIGTYNEGLICFNCNTKTFCRLDHVPVKYTTDIHTDGRYVFLSSDGQGAFTLDTQQEDAVVERYHASDYNPLAGSPAEEDGVIPVKINAIYTFDKFDGAAWLGTFLEGFSHQYTRRNIFSTYRFGAFNTAHLRVTSFCIHGDDYIIGTREGAWLINERKGILKYLSPKQLGDGDLVNNIRYFAGKFVIGGRGLTLVDTEHGNQVTHLNSHEAVSTASITSMRVTPDGSYLLATSNMGLIVIDKDFHVERLISNSNSHLPNNQYATDVLVDNYGKAWVAMSKDLVLVDWKTGKVQTDNFPKGFFNNTPYLRLSLSDNGNILACSENAVYWSSADLSSFGTLWEDKKQEFGALSNVMRTKDGYLVSSNQGLYAFDKEFRTFRKLSENEGLSSPQMNKFEMQYSTDGTLWVCNEHGLNYASPESWQHHASSLLGKVTIDKMRRGESEVDDAELTHLLQTPEFGLGWNFTSNKLVISPLLLDYGNNGSRCFEYFLDADTTTGFCSPQAPLQIEGLSLGNHTLVIQVAGHPETATRFTITVRPSFLFCVEAALFVALALLVWLTFIMRQRARLRRKLLHKKHEQEREIAGREAVAQHIKAEAEEREREEQTRKENLYITTRLNEEEYKRLHTLVDEYLRKEKAYMKQSLKLTDISAALGCSTAKLSQMFSLHLGVKYFDYLNRYRMQEFKRMLNNPEYEDYTIVAISEMCGFKKSSFFAVFKEMEGCTPSEYARKHKKRKSSN